MDTLKHIDAIFRGFFALPFETMQLAKYNFLMQDYAITPAGTFVATFDESEDSDLVVLTNDHEVADALRSYTKS